MVRLLPYLAKPAVSLSILLVLLSHLYVTTYGTGNLFVKEIYGGAFDALADSLKRGSSEIPIAEIYMEAIRLQDKVAMYFGPFPALPRMIANTVAPDLWGKWSRAAMLTAAALALFSFLLLWLRIAGGKVPDRDRAGWLGFLTLGFGLGTPVIFLVSCGFIYHEAIIWGLAWSLFALSAAAALESQRPSYSPRHLFLFGAGAGLSFLSRVTFGAPLIFLAAVISLDAAVQRKQEGPLRAFRAALPCAAPVLLCVLFYLWYNNDRFGSPFVFGTARHVLPDEYSIQVLDRTGTFNAGRIPTALQNYFDLPGRSIVSEPPYFKLAVPHIFNPELYPYRYQRDGIGTLMLTAPWLLLGSFVGLYAFYYAPRMIFALTVAALGGEILLVCAVRHLSHRFTAEFLPLLAYLFAHGIALLYSAPSAQHLRRLFFAVLLATGLISVAANFGTTMSWNAWDNWAAPDRWRKMLMESYVVTTPPRIPRPSSGLAPP